jgi:hypothetical protein
MSRHPTPPHPGQDERRRSKRSRRKTDPDSR